MKFKFIIGFLLLSLNNLVSAEENKPDSGLDIAIDRSRGNCLACHHLMNEPRSESAGTIGPPLYQMKARFNDKSQLKQQIWDAAKRNPATIMPPFGRNKILSEEEINLITDYIYQL